jgi:hypothetical protein
MNQEPKRIIIIKIIGKYTYNTLYPETRTQTQKENLT